MQLAQQIRAAGLPCFPCRSDKGPAVGRGEGWRDVSQRPIMACFWPSGIVGIPVPPDVVVLDLDRYKGITREQVEAAAGPIPWDAALLQTTMQGGEHYAFRAPAWPVAQRSNHGKGVLPPGLDTRTGGDGYIATGDGYTPHGAGVYRLAAPDSLPVLPDGLRPFLERVQDSSPVPPPPPPHDTDSPDLATVREALRHIDPGCGRTEWIEILMALRASWPDDDATGAALAQEWSAGELWPDGAPDNYLADGPGSPAHQFATLKPTGGVGPGTLYYHAIQSGWLPPRTLDTSAAFGGGGLDGAAFVDLLARVQAEGGNPEHTPALQSAIAAAACNETQRAVLLAVFQRELREAGLNTRSLRAALEPSPDTLVAGYGKNHTHNARLFLRQAYPGDTLIRSEQVYYAYTGKVWRPLSDGGLESQIAHSMLASSPQSSTVSGTAGMVGRMVHTEDPPPGHSAPGVVVFDNGVLHLDTGALTPHAADYQTTCLLPYDYAPGARCDAWRAFLNNVFSGDSERVYLLQEWFGYLLTPGYEHHKILLLIGAPRSGKGTIGRILERVVGEDNYTGGSLQDFVNSSILNLWRHKTALFIGDAQNGVPRGIRDAVIERIKQISGNDRVAFDRKWKDAANTTLPTRITIAANALPRLFDDSGALASRIMPLPVDGSHLGCEDLGLFDRLADEAGGIALWALAGRARLQAQGRFTAPMASSGEAQYMEDTYSPLAGFLRDCAQYRPGARTTVIELFTAYLQWAQNNGDGERLSQRQVTAAVKQHTTRHGVRYCVVRSDEGTTARGFDGLNVTPPTAAAFGGNVVPINTGG